MHVVVRVRCARVGVWHAQAQGCVCAQAQGSARARGRRGLCAWAPELPSDPGPEEHAAAARACPRTCARTHIDIDRCVWSCPTCTRLWASVHAVARLRTSKTHTRARAGSEGPSCAFASASASASLPLTRVYAQRTRACTHAPAAMCTHTHTRACAGKYGLRASLGARVCTAATWARIRRTVDVCVHMRLCHASPSGPSRRTSLGRACRARVFMCPLDVHTRSLARVCVNACRPPGASHHRRRHRRRVRARVASHRRGVSVCALGEPLRRPANVRTRWFWQCARVRDRTHERRLCVASVHLGARAATPRPGRVWGCACVQSTHAVTAAVCAPGCVCVRARRGR